ncbi:MAG: hypothetical protein Q8940_07155 [Bacteroidota bacterium]|nr:hypothetical protein [Bacteroidota bacterium]
MNVKLTEFNGLYTNIDENDLKFELFRESVNFRHEQGFAQFEPHTFVKFDRCFPLPEGYRWEKGCIATLTSDPLSESMDIKSYEVFVMVCIKNHMISGEMYYDRKIFMSEYGSDVFYGLFSEDKNPLPNCKIKQADLCEFQMDQEVHFLNVDGVLKIYLPHMSFWLGRLERTLYKADLSFPNPINGFYFDRLVEPYDPLLLYTSYDNGDMTKPLCYPGRRIGLSCTISIDDNQTSTVNERPIDVTYQGTRRGHTTGIGSAWFTHYVFSLVDKDSGEIISPYQIIGNTLYTIPPYQQYFEVYPQSDMDSCWFYKQKDAEIMLIPTGYNSFIKFADGNKLSDLYGVLTDPIVQDDTEVTGSFYWISFAQFQADVTSRGMVYYGEVISSSGFENTIKSFDILATATLDNKSEIIIYKNTLATQTTQPYFAIKVSNCYLAQDSNARITKLRFYIKALSYLDYKLAKTFDFLDPKCSSIVNFYIYSSAVEDIMLTQMIGFAFDKKSEKYYRLLTGLRDIAYERGYSLSLSSTNISSVYYSAIGQGKLMTDIFYSTSIVERLGLNKVNAISSTNGKFIAMDSYKSSVISVSGDNVEPVIDIVDDLEYGVKSKKDVAKTQTGLVINTLKGIFMTNGFEKQKISEPINDIVEVNFSSGYIYYNPIKQELIYFPYATDKPYRYRFERQKWEQINYQGTEAEYFTVKSYMYDSGGLELLMGDDIYIRSGYNALPSGMLTTSFSDLGEATMDKLLNYISLDMTGKVTLFIRMDDNVVGYTFETSQRKTLELRMTKDNRFPFEKFHLRFLVNAESFTLYKAELDLTPIKRRTYGTKEITAFKG